MLMWSLCGACNGLYGLGSLKHIFKSMDSLCYYDGHVCFCYDEWLMLNVKCSYNLVVKGRDNPSSGILPQGVDLEGLVKYHNSSYE